MKFRDLFKGIGSSLGKILGDDPRYRVEATDDGSLVAETVKAGMNREDAALAVKAYRDMAKRGNLYSSRESSAITLDYEDNGSKGGTTPLTEQETSFRDDETMRQVRNTGRNDKSAKELPNSERKSGGRDRGARLK